MAWGPPLSKPGTPPLASGRGRPLPPSREDPTNATVADFEAPDAARRGQLLEDWFRPMGLTLHLVTDSPAIQAAGRASFRGFGEPPRPRVPDLVFRLFAHSVDDGPPGEPVLRSDGPLVYQTTGRGSTLVADCAAGHAFGCFSPATLANPAFFRWHFLDLALFFMLEHRGFVGIHAAALARDGRGLLLRAPSGEGKTTLAFAAARAGFRALAEDVVWLAPGPTGEARWWGAPWAFRMLPDAGTLFPDLAGHRPSVQINGETKIEVDLERLSPGSTTVSARPGAVVLLRRAPGGTSRIEELSAAQALERWRRGGASREHERPRYDEAVAPLLAGRLYGLALRRRRRPRGRPAGGAGRGSLVVSRLAAACEALARGLDDTVALRAAWAEDEAGLREACQVHGVAPLLHLRLAANGAAPPPLCQAPPPLCSWLEHQYRRNRERVARMLGELREILARFDAEGVPLMPMKGAVLLACHYREAGERPMNDLDLLLPEEHTAAGDRLLEELGYRRTFEGWKHRRYARADNEEVVDPTCEHPDNPRRLEVHPRCRERIRDEVVDLTGPMWASAERRSLLAARAWVPSTETLWLHLLIHTTHHVLLNTFRLLQLVDLCRLTPEVGRPETLLGEIDPRAVYPALALLHRYFPSDRTSALVAGQARRLAPSFTAWADALDLFAASYLDPTPWRAT